MHGLYSGHAYLMRRNKPRKEDQDHFLRYTNFMKLRITSPHLQIDCNMLRETRIDSISAPTKIYG